MDIDLLAKMVKEAVMDHDSVTLPGVGSFVAELVPAVFTDRGYTINPPYRRLFFLPREGDDTLLADLYAGANGISQADALRVLLDYLGEMKEVLKIRKTLVLPGLGRLRATRENHFFFVADEDLDIYPEGLGLEPISLKTHVETPEEVHAAVASLAEVLEPEHIVAEPAPEAPVAGPAAEPETESVEPEPIVAEPASEPVAKPAPALESAPEAPAAEPAPEPSVAAPAPEPPARKKHGFWRFALILLLVLAVVTLSWMIVGRVDPDWVDSFLYSEEELEILRY
jgi:nucleoid DNA-binding protein